MILLLVILLIMILIFILPQQKSLTVVSAYYDIPSKRSSDDYHIRLKRFLGKFDCDMVFYTSKDLVDKLKSYRGKFNYRTKFIVSELEDLEFMKKYGFDFWKEQCKKSYDIHKDKPLLCGIWYSKKTFLKTTIDKNPFGSTHFAWIDAGIMDEEYTEDVLYVNNKILEIGDKMNMYSVVELPEGVDFFDKTMPDYIAGDTYFGSLGACRKHVNNYDTVVENYIKNDKSICDDQKILNSLALNYKDNYIVHHGEWRSLFKKIIRQQ